ncbi:tetratricopeptide repeat protein [Telmatobacter bradus]|uniref:tetratricopeptide repeat protein n=1 Tax=Telmatobacter bradus TaxID=474953 RepID=UPI003B431BCE
MRVRNLKVMGLLVGQSLAGLVLAAAMSANAQQAPQQPTPPAATLPGGNPFPEDTSSIPVFDTAPPPMTEDEAGSSGLTLDVPDGDPVRSPDGDASAGETPAGDSAGYSSSSAGLDSLLPDPNAPDGSKKGRRDKHGRPELPPHVETAAEDLTVAKYYVDNKNWKAALSRFQSAMVLSPEEPEVYWGMAECQRHLGDMASAKANYQKMVEYDPDSKHGKDAAKALKSPEIAKAAVTAAK